jgi:hypothetical protein
MSALYVSVDIFVLSLNRTVPELCVNVPPVLVKFPPIVVVPEVAVRVPLLILKAFAIVTAGLDVKLQAPEAPLNVRL